MSLPQFTEVSFFEPGVSQFEVSATIPPVPEPSALVLFATGLASLLPRIWRDTHNRRAGRPPEPTPIVDDKVFRGEARWPDPVLAKQSSPIAFGCSIVRHARAQAFSNADVRLCGGDSLRCSTSPPPGCQSLSTLSTGGARTRPVRLRSSSAPPRWPTIRTTAWLPRPPVPVVLNPAPA